MFRVKIAYFCFHFCFSFCFALVSGNNTKNRIEFNCAKFSSFVSLIHANGALRSHRSTQFNFLNDLLFEGARVRARKFEVFRFHSVSAADAGDCIA